MIEPKITIEVAPNSNVKEEYKFKVVVVGDSGVGKTNLIKRFINDTFNKDSKATVGVEFLSKTYLINQEVFKIEIWDTAGQERYKSITAAYYKGAKGAMIVYDVTNQTSFDNVDNWANEIKEKAARNINLMIVGNKTDLTDKIVVTSEVATEKAKALEIPIMETSALDSTNVKEAFYQLLREMYKSVKDLMKEYEQKQAGTPVEQDSNRVALDTKEEKKEKKGGCC